MSIFSSRFKILLLILMLLLSVEGISQTYKYFNYNVEVGLPSPQVYDSYEDDHGFIWFTTDRGVCRFDGKEFKTYSLEEGLESITNFRFSPISGNKFWLNSINGTFSYWDGNKFHPFQFNNKIEKELNLENKWSTILSIENNILSFFIEKNEFIYPKYYYGINIKTGKITRHPFNHPPIKENTSYNTKLYLADRNIFASPSDSIYFKKVLPYFNKSKKIITIFSDKVGNIFIGTYNGLLLYLKDNPNKPIKIFNNRAITSINQSRNGAYWFTSLDKGVFVIPSLKIQTLNLNDFGLKNDEMFNRIEISEDNKSMLFRSDKFYLELFSNLQININSCTEITQKKSYYIFPKENLSNGDYLWYNTSTFNIASGGYFDKKIKKYRHKKIKSKIYNLRTLCAKEDSFHTIWVGTSKNLFFKNIYDSTSTHFNIEKFPFKQKQIRVTKLAPDKNGMWISTINNGLLYRYQNGSYLKIDRDLLLSKTIHSIFLDKNLLYIATNRGLNILDYSFANQKIIINNIKSINSSMGIQSDFILDVKKWQNKIWLATSTGISFFDPKIFIPQETKPNLFIKGISINGKNVNPSQIQPNPHNIKILYGAPSLTKLPPRKPQFRYNLDKNPWSFTNSTHVTYNNLESGNHTFELQCANLNGKWSKSEKLNFFIEYPFYEKTWFRITMLFLLGILIWSYIKTRENKLKKIAKKELSYKEIELGMLRNQINPHFTFNSLNMIQSHIFANNPIKANEHLGKLSHLIRKGLELSREKTITIQDDIAFIEAYLELEKERFQDKFIYQLNINSKLKQSKLYIPPLMTQPIIENILKHAFKNIKSTGHIVIDYKYTKDYLEIIIADNGTGFDVNENKSKQSLGLEITKKRIEILNEINHYKSSISIHSKIGVGTTVILKLPVDL